MNKTFLRNFLLFVIILLICVSALTYRLVMGERSIERKDDLVEHTYEVISQSERLSFSIERMLSSQRGYLLTGNESFLEKYVQEKKQISDEIAFLNKEFTEKFNIACQKIVDLFGRPLYRDNFTIYLTTFGRCPYNYEEGYLLIQ